MQVAAPSAGFRAIFLFPRPVYLLPYVQYLAKHLDTFVTVAKHETCETRSHHRDAIYCTPRPLIRLMP